VPIAIWRLLTLRTRPYCPERAACAFWVRVDQLLLLLLLLLPTKRSTSCGAQTILTPEKGAPPKKMVPEMPNKPAAGAQNKLPPGAGAGDAQGFHFAGFMK
jgi:hypothetical protein